MLNPKKQKLPMILAVAVTALQIPLLMLWKITVDVIQIGSCEPKVTTDPSGTLIYERVFQWEFFWRRS